MSAITITMALMIIIAVAVGLYWARFHINRDVRTLYATRPLSNQQIDALNVELKELKKIMGDSLKKD